MRRACRRFGLPYRTIVHWLRERSRRVRARRCGRPAARLSAELRRRIEDVVAELRGRLSVEALKQGFPSVPRRRLRAIRDEWRHAHRPHDRTLAWTRPGTVWAMDYTTLDHAVEGRAPHVLTVRDVASRMHLAAVCTPSADAATTMRTVQRLVDRHGAPLVLKTDNGSHFTADDVAAQLERMEIEHLRSPVGTPTYNGCIEAGANAFKAKLGDHLSIEGRCCWPLAEDVEQVRRTSNEESRPWGRSGPTAAERWRERTRPTDKERVAFRLDVGDARRRLLECHRRDDGGEGSAWRPTPQHRATVARRAIRLTLEAWGLLEIRRRLHSSGQSSGILDEN